MGRRQRNRVKTKKGKWIVVMVALILCASLYVGQVNLSKKSSVLSAKKAKLTSEIELEKERKQELDNQETYMQTDEYTEKVAREKLGMVKDNEILFKAKDK